MNHTKEPEALVHARWLSSSLTIGAPEAAAELRRLHEVEKQRDELLSDLAEAKRSAEFNFEQYQDVGRLLHEECEKTEKLLAALGVAQATINCAGISTPKIVRDTVEKYAEAISSVKGGE